MANTSKVFTKFKDPVNSFPLGEMNLGLLKPGRYSGFNVLEEEIGLNIRIKHSNAIVKSSVTTDDVITTVNFGSALLPNGSIIHNEEDIDDSGIALIVDSNLGNANIRYDLVICEHEYVEVAGGQPPLYFIQKGPNDGSEPELSNPEKQIVLGKIEVAAGGYTFGALTYTPTLVPLPGEMDPEMLVQYISDIIAIGYATTLTAGKIRIGTPLEVSERVDATVAITPASVIYLVPTDTLPGMLRKATDNEVIANTLTPATPEAYVTLDQFRKYVGLRDLLLHPGNSTTIPDTWNGKTINVCGDGGSTPLITLTIPNSLSKNFKVELLCKTQNVQLSPAAGVTLMVPTGFLAKSNSLGSKITLECVDATDGLVFVVNGDLKKNQLTISTGLVPMKSAVPYFPTDNLLEEFDGTGLGVEENVLGWAICNGQNGTRDLRGKFLIQYQPSDTDIDECGNTGGAKTHTLTEGQMPKHSHDGFGESDGSWPFGITGPNTKAGSDGGYSMDNYYYKTSEKGNNEAHNNMPPFYTTIYIQRVS